MHVKDKVCVVTGAASGIGAAVARAWAEAGARGVVVAVDAQDVELDELVVPLRPLRHFGIGVPIRPGLDVPGAADHRHQISVSARVVASFRESVNSYYSVRRSCSAQHNRGQ